MAFGGVAPESDTVPALLTPGEIVSTKEASDQFGDEILRLNQVAGGGEGSGGQMVINIYATDGESIYRMIVDNAAQFARGFNQIKSERFIE